MSVSISVSNLELYRMWRASDDLDLPWLLRRLSGEEPQTEAMAAGEALHQALERSTLGETGQLWTADYRFYFKCDCSVELPQARELRVQKEYGDLVVRGRVDALIGKRVIDYKTTSHWDPDRLMAGYQWRYYLDMLDADEFSWQVFVMSQFGDFAEAGRLVHAYEIYQVHELSQRRYDDLEHDCDKLAQDFLAFARELDRSGYEWRRLDASSLPPAEAVR